MNHKFGSDSNTGTLTEEISKSSSEILVQYYVAICLLSTYGSNALDVF